MTLAHLINLVRKLRAPLPSRKSCFSIILYFFMGWNSSGRILSSLSRNYVGLDGNIAMKISSELN